jgi:hypothetical protein
VGPSYVSPSCQLGPPSLITTYRLTPPPSKPPNHSYIPPPHSDVTLHYPLHVTLHYRALPPPPLHCLHVSPTSADHLSKDMWQTTSARTCGRPCQQGHVEDHVSKYTWHNQMMTSVKRKLARAMSTSDVSKLRHSGRFTSGVSSPTNVKSPEVPKDEGLKSLSVVRSEDHFGCILNR